MELNRTYNEDCLEGMKRISDCSVDMILTDLPYGRTNNKWDVKVDLHALFEQYRRIIKENGCIALFADGMLIKELMTEGADIWRYNLVWDKGLVSNFLNANRQPLRQHEEIIIFYKRQPTYNPQFTEGKPLHGMGNSFILTYTNEGETVLDSCSGSGTTQEACIRTRRNYIAFEKETEIFKQSIARLEGVRENG